MIIWQNCPVVFCWKRAVIDQHRICQIIDTISHKPVSPISHHQSAALFYKQEVKLPIVLLSQNKFDNVMSIWHDQITFWQPIRGQYSSHLTSDSQSEDYFMNLKWLTLSLIIPVPGHCWTLTKRNSEGHMTVCDVNYSLKGHLTSTFDTVPVNSPDQDLTLWDHMFDIVWMVHYWIDGYWQKTASCEHQFLSQSYNISWLTEHLSDYWFYLTHGGNRCTIIVTS